MNTAYNRRMPVALRSSQGEGGKQYHRLLHFEVRAENVPLPDHCEPWGCDEAHERDGGIEDRCCQAPRLHLF